jgi:hypothetical protein
VIKRHHRRRVPVVPYADRRGMLLIELRLLRRTQPSRRVVKLVQSEMRQARWLHYSERVI